MSQFKLVHDESFVEENSGNQYIVAKVYDSQDKELGQIKLQLTSDTQPTVKISVSGKINVDEDLTRR